MAATRELLEAPPYAAGCGSRRVEATGAIKRHGIATVSLAGEGARGTNSASVVRGRGRPRHHAAAQKHRPHQSTKRLRRKGWRRWTYGTVVLFPKVPLPLNLHVSHFVRSACPGSFKPGATWATGSHLPRTNTPQ